jgi:hypothetical protein
MNKIPEDLYKERLKRFDDAVRLKIPDRVPFVPLTHFFAARYLGMTSEEAFYDSDRWFGAYKKTILDLEPDLYYPAMAAPTPRPFDLLKCRQVKWPGHGVPSHSGLQFVEGEYMKADEYDAFLFDPTDFIVRTYMPRIFEALEPLRTLSPLTVFMHGYKGALTTAMFANPLILTAFEALYRAGVEAAEYLAKSVKFDREMAGLGFPQAFGAPALAPFDVISDQLRGMRGAMLDMYRQPDKLLAATEKIFPVLLNTTVESAKKSGNPRVFIPLHRGADGFMSVKQFETFYWPGLKRLLLGLIEEGLTPCPFIEGVYDSRLPYFCELPRGKIIGFFDGTDLFKAKELVGDTMCIAGNMPLSLLQTGTPEGVKEYSKKLIDVVGKGGGFVMSSRATMDDASPELVKVWAAFTKEYGIYA